MRRFASLLSQNRTTEAFHLVEEQVQKDPENLELLRWRGRIWYASGRGEEYRQQLIEESARSPEKSLPCFLLADLEGEEASRERWAREALRRNPSLLPAKVRLAAIANSLAKGHEAQDLLNEVLHQDPTHWEARYEKARWAAERGQVKEAIVDLEVSIASRPSHGAAQLLLAQLYLQESRLAEASRSLEKGLYLSPGSVRGALVRIALAFARQRHTAALDFIREGKQRWPRESEFWKFEVEVYVATQRWKEARKALKEGIHLLPPEQQARLAAQLAWGERDQEALLRALQEWAKHPGELLLLHRGLLAYLDADLPEMERIFSLLPPQDQQQLAPLVKVLGSAQDRKLGQVLFLVALGLLFGVMCAFLLRLRKGK